jgi:predicted enzyme related to lactoylglutathione lyase
MAHPNDGRFVWHELMSTDPAKAMAFYTALVGWKVTEVATFALFQPSM